VVVVVELLTTQRKALGAQAAVETEMRIQEQTQQTELRIQVVAVAVRQGQ
jgi:hypothetical protein